MVTFRKSGFPCLVAGARRWGRTKPPLMLLLAIPLALPLLWLLVIRPYCIRNGKGYTPGASMHVTLWIDWQEAVEIARAKGDKGMVAVCHIVFWLQVLLVIPLVLQLLVTVVMGPGE